MLNYQHRNKIIKILESHSVFQTYRGRKQLCDFAGLGKIISQIDLEGAPFVVAGEIIQLLESYGRLQYEHHALGIFLSAFNEFLGDADENKKFIDYILVEYELMTPERKNESSVNWRTKTTENVNERIIGENTLKHVSFLQLALEASRMVAFIDVKQWSGTGFLISPRLLLTNNHVIPNKDLLDDTTFRFNYQLTKAGNEEIVKNFKASPHGIFHTDKELDYSVIELEGDPGLEWGYAKLDNHAAKTATRVNIIQHPAGLPKQIAFQNNFIEYVDSRVVQYLTSTMSGSSGSPVFNDDWNVIAVHHAGGMLTEPGTKQTFFRNEGILISAILENMPTDVLDVIK